MPISVVKLIACFVFGVALAQSWLPIGAGFLGGLVLIVGAHLLRRRWQRDRAAPDAAERATLLSVAGTLVCLGYFLVMLHQIGMGIDMHGREMRKMANELWILIAAALVAQWVAQARNPIRDEFDARIAARALAASSYLLLALQAALVLWFGLLLEADSPLRTIEMLAHLMIGSWMVAHVFYSLFCMHAYSDLRTAEREIS